MRSTFTLQKVSRTFTRQFQALQAKIKFILFNKLKKQPEKSKEYDDIIFSQIAKNIIEVGDNIPVPGKCHYFTTPCCL